MSYSFIGRFFDKYKRFFSYDYGENVINVDRMMNEWVWHNKTFSWGIAKDPARSVDVYLNADDDRHGFLSKILNWRFWA